MQRVGDGVRGREREGLMMMTDEDLREQRRGEEVIGSG